MTSLLYSVLVAISVVKRRTKVNLFISAKILISQFDDKTLVNIIAHDTQYAAIHDWQLTRVRVKDINDLAILYVIPTVRVYWCWCSVLGDLSIPAGSLSICLGIGLSITLKVVPSEVDGGCTNGHLNHVKKKTSMWYKISNHTLLIMCATEV